MKVLAVDTSTDFLSIAIASGQEIFSFTASGPLKHSERLVPLIEMLLTEAKIEPKKLDLLTYSKGPGSFTGLRIGLAALKGLSFGGNIPMAGVPSLDVWAYGLEWFPGPVLPVIDAKKNSFYTAIFFEGNRLTPYLDASVVEIETLLSPYEKVLLTGPGAVFLKEKWGDAKAVIDPGYPSGGAVRLITLGKAAFLKNGKDAEDEGPLYIRLSDAEINLNKR